MRLPDGLIVRRISLGPREVVVVKQLANAQFHFFEIDEWDLLKRLDQQDGLSNADEHIASFYQSAAQEGLITDHPDSVSPTRPAKPPWYANPLVIRLPGVDPSQTLASVMQSLDRLGRSRLKWIAIATALLGFLVAVLNLSELMSDSAAAASRVFASPNQGWLIFVVALALVKITHELAHGLACHGGGGRCREMGVMFLFGVPCLYCDVSDTWLMPKRRQRMFVSAAGMLAEFLIASIAALIWSVTYHGFLHDLMAMIVVVASVSTLVVNANPLLRYDGYFILSDCIGVPNLSSQANEAFRDIVNQNNEEPKQYGLASYAVASGVYRVLVIGVIVWIACGMLLKWVGMGLAIPVAMWIGWSILRRWIFVEVATISPRLTFGFAAALTAFVLWVPLPQSVRVGGLIRPAEERAIYAPTTGRLNSSPRKIEVLSWNQQLDWLAAQGESEESKAELRSRKIDRLQDASLTVSLPLWRQHVRTATAKADSLASQALNSTTAIPVGHQLFEPPNQHPNNRRAKDHRKRRTGAPTSPRNHGLVIAEGEMIGRIGDSRARFVSAYVPNQCIASVRTGAPVGILLGSYEQRSLHGTVIAVATDPVDDLPTEILASGWVPIQTTSANGATPEKTHYEVKIEVKSSTILPARLVVPVRIKMPADSLWNRLLRNWRSAMTIAI